MLKTLLLRKKLDGKKALLEEFRAKQEEIEKREKELEQAVNEIDETISEEDKQTIEKEVEEFEKEKNDHEENKKKLEEEIEELETELKELEETQEARKKTNKGEARKGEVKMERRKFFGLNEQERTAFFADDEVKNFLERARDFGRQERSISGTELTIPTTVLDLIRENILHYSKLVGKVRLVKVSGKSRQNIMGNIPEAVWTEMCAKLNELSFGFNQTEVDGYKVGGYIFICKATLEDSDYNLATEIINALGQAIGIALDKAILYGLGTKMPLGIVTRLAQTSEPSNYPANARPWKDLQGNLITISGKTGLEFYKEILKSKSKMKSKYATAGKIWIMNDATFTELQIQAMNFNQSGAIVSLEQMRMPVAGGEIIILSDEIIPDNNIVAGYGDLYLLAERQGSSFARSDEYLFVEDMVAFKGTARYDGMPVIAEGFIAIGIGSAPVKTVSFAGDTANDATLSSLDVEEALSPSFASNKYEYEITTTKASITVKAVASQSSAKVSITYDGKPVLNGSQVKLTVTAEGKPLVINVKNGLSELTYTVKVKKAS